MDFRGNKGSMNAKISLQMTLLGLGVMVFYAGLLAVGQVSMEILPHYAISAIIFLCSGKMMRQMAARLPTREGDEDRPQPLVPDWAMRNAMLNWVAAGVLVSIMAIILAKPDGMTFVEMMQFAAASSEQLPSMTFPMP
jgi:hypothetical protein